MAETQTMQRVVRRRAAISLTAIALIAGACGGDDAPAADPPDSTAPETTEAASETMIAAASDTEGATTTEVAATTPAAVTTDPPVPDDTAVETTDEESTDEGDGSDQGLVTNFVEIDGVQYATNIDMCFGAPGKELEVISVVRGSPESDAYAFVYTDDQSASGLTLSEFSVSDVANGLEWRTGGQDATDIVLEEKRIAATATVNSPDGATAEARFDFTCPG